MRASELTTLKNIIENKVNYGIEVKRIIENHSFLNNEWFIFFHNEFLEFRIRSAAIVALMY